MNIRLLIGAGALTLAGAAQAAYISPDAALARIAADSNAPRRISAVSKGETPRLLQTTVDNLGKPAVYLFGDQEGFMILAADSDAEALLGYSDQGTFDLANMPPAMQWWLDMYTAEISYLRSPEGMEARKAPRKVTTNYEAIKPLCTTKWSQAEPYYNMTPIYNGKHCMTGCVATGMAQAIKYWNYPERGQGEITFNVSHIGDLYMNFAEAEFDWEHMTNTYGSNSTQVEKDAVALLMKACGYASRMWYNTNSSGTQSSYIADAIRRYFGYDDEISFQERNNYTPSEWTDLIYGNIKNVGPVIYSGYSNVGEGHCFVADGYDGKGLFHINWGWGGQSDGYFLLSALNPYSQGIGGSPGGFSFSQNAVIDMHPPHVKTGKSDIWQDGTVKAEVSGDTYQLTFSKNPNLNYYNKTDETLDVTFALVITSNTDAAFAEQVKPQAPVTMEPNVKTNLSKVTDKKFSFSLSDCNLADGEYRVELKFRTADSDPWHTIDCQPGKYTYSTLTKNGTSYKAVNTVSKKVSINTEAEFTKPLYYDYPTTVSFTITNTGNIDTSVGVAPCLLNSNNEIVAKTAGLMYDLDPGESVSKDWTFTFAFDSTPDKTKTRNLRLALYNPNTWAILWSDSEYTPIAPADPPAMKIGKFRIENAEREGTTYFVTDYADLQFYTEAYCSEGENKYPLHISIWYNDPTSNTQKNVVNTPVEDYATLEVPFSNVAATTSVSMEGIGRPGGTYSAYLSYNAFGQWNHVPSRATGKTLELKFKLDPAGIETVADEIEDAAPVYYNLQGMRVENPGKGLYIVVRNNKTTKEFIR